MTTLEIVLIILLWLIVGLFVAFKRGWYKAAGDDAGWGVFFSIVFAPLNLIITFIRVYCVAKWDNTNI